MSKYAPLWKWINKNKTDEFLVMTGIEYGNSRLLFRTCIYLYNMIMDDGGEDCGNKKYYFEASYRKRNVTGRAGR